jgi:hypothetical protein
MPPSHPAGLRIEAQVSRACAGPPGHHQALTLVSHILRPASLKDERPNGHNDKAISNISQELASVIILAPNESGGAGRRPARTFGISQANPEKPRQLDAEQLASRRRGAD